MVVRDIYEIGFALAEIEGPFLAAGGSAELQIECLDRLKVPPEVEGAPDGHRRFQRQLRRKAHQNFIHSRRCPGFVINEHYRSIAIKLDPVRAGGEREDGTIIERDAEFALELGFDRLDLVAAPCFKTEKEIDCPFEPGPL